MDDRCRQVWVNLLDSSELEEPMVSPDDLEDAVSLMIDARIDPSKFAGNLCALVSGGTGIMSPKDLFFGPEKTSQPQPTQSMTDEFIFGRPLGTPLWMLAAFPDVVNWLNSRMAALHRTSDNESDETAKVLSLWGIDLRGSGDLDEDSFKNSAGQVKAKYFRNLIHNYATDAGKTLETAVEPGSPNDIYAGFSLLQSVGEDSLFTLIASMTTKYYMELRGTFANCFPDEASLIAAAGIIDASHYILVTQQIRPEQIIALAHETQEGRDRLVDFMMRFEPLIMSADAPELPFETVRESCKGESKAVEHATKRIVSSYTKEPKIATSVRLFMESGQFSDIRKMLGVPQRSLLNRIKGVLFGE